MGKTAQIKVVVVFPDFIGREFFCLVPAILHYFFSIIPPCDDRLKMLQPHRLCLGKMLVALRHVKAIVPDAFRRPGVVKEKDIGSNAGVWRKDAARHTDNGMQIEAIQQLFLDAQLGIVIAKQEAIRQYYGSPAILLEPVHNHGHEKICRFTAGQIIREISLYAGIFMSAIRGIHENNLNLPRLKSRGSQPRILTDSDTLGYPRSSYGSYMCYTPVIWSPSFRIFIAAFTSLSCTAPHCGQVHSRTDKSFVSEFLCPQQ